MSGSGLLVGDLKSLSLIKSHTGSDGVEGIQELLLLRGSGMLCPVIQGGCVLLVGDDRINHRTNQAQAHITCKRV